MLAQTTIAALGLMVLLLGIGGAASAMAVAAFFVAHALYKAALFLVAGMLEKSPAPVTSPPSAASATTCPSRFIAAALSGLSMFGLPPFLGYFAKEAIYAPLGTASRRGLAILVTLVIGNIVFGAVGLALRSVPSWASEASTITPPARRRASPSGSGRPHLASPASAVVFVVPLYGDRHLAPMAGAISRVRRSWPFARL